MLLDFARGVTRSSPPPPMRFRFFFLFPGFFAEGLCSHHSIIYRGQKLGCSHILTGLDEKGCDVVFVSAVCLAQVLGI